MPEDLSTVPSGPGRPAGPGISHARSRSFPEALTALSLKHSRSSSDASNDTEKSVSVSSRTSDSGYSSSGTTLSPTTPEHIRTLIYAAQSIPQETFPQDGRRMSFAAIARTPTLKVFERPIPESIQNRFHDLNELFSKALLDHLKRAKVDPSTHRTISIKLKYLGQNEQSSKPCVLILCHKDCMGKVKQFFNRQAVKSQYQPSDSSLPQLEVKVFDRPPRLIGLTASIASNNGSQTQGSAAYPAVCGKSLRLSEDAESYFGTLGGLVMVTTYAGSSTVYGMSAGHIVPNAGQRSSAHSHFGLHSIEKHWSIDSVLEGSEQYNADLEDDDDTASYAGSEKTNISLELEGIQNESPKTSMSKLARLAEVPEVPWTTLGPLLTTSASQNTGSPQKDLDWSLIAIDNPLLYDPSLFPNRLSRMDVKEATSHKLVGLREDRHVEVFCGMSGQKAGVISRTMSMFSLGPAKGFLKTYDLKIAGGTVLQEGDCGAWVIDTSTKSVYGHVVASDDFGDAYVVPLSDSFEDMMTRLPAFSIKIPTTQEIHTWYSQESGTSFPLGTEENITKKESERTHAWPPIPHAPRSSKMPPMKNFGLPLPPPPQSRKYSSTAMERYTPPPNPPPLLKRTSSSSGKRSRRASESYALSLIEDSGYSSFSASGSGESFAPPPKSPLLSPRSIKEKKYDFSTGRLIYEGKKVLSRIF